MPETLTRLEHASEGPERSAPLLIAHGLFGSARNFNTLARRLATGRRVVAVDMRNHGSSPWSDDMDYPAMADDLAATVKDLGGRAHVLGHSMGGKTSMALALSHPDLVESMIVADIAPVAYTHTHLPYIQAMRSMDLSGISRRGEAEPMLAEAVPDRMLRAFLLQNLVVEDGAARWRLNLAALETAMPDLIGWPSAMDDRTFPGPAFFLYGGSSDYMSPLLEPRVRELFPKAEFKALPGAGHWLHAEQPDNFVGAVDDWLGNKGQG